MSGPDGPPVVADAAALQVALSAAARACACYQMGLLRIGDDALLSAAELAGPAMGDGTAHADALALVLGAVARIGDNAEFSAIVSQLTGGER